VDCPKCGGKAKRDSDTMDTFVCSSWYFLRYTDPRNSNEPFSIEKAKEWLPVDKYIGGIEHACGHLIYFRFFTKFLYDIGWLSVNEPAMELFNHGMVLDKEGKVMSKSQGNVVSPIDMIDKYGTDVSRIAMYFAAPSEREILWNEEGISGSVRFLNRIYNFAQLARKSQVTSNINIEDLSGFELIAYKKLNQTIKKVEEDIFTLQFNTAIASMMELLNVMDDLDASNSTILRFCVERLAQIIAPFVPHLSEEIWALLGHKESIFRSHWPVYDKIVLKEDTVTFVVQINGKLRTTIILPVDTPESEANKVALNDDKVKKIIENKTILKTIFVANKLINIVVK
jgi:leucyl-tRNA synthetase